MIRLRPYQSECIRAVLERIRAGERRALLHLATGTGKTLIAAKLAFFRDSDRTEMYLCEVEASQEVRR